MNQHTCCAPLFFLCSILIFCGCIIHTVESSSAAGQDTLIGIVGQDFIMIGADSSVSQSIALTASNLDKIAILVEPFPPQDERRLQQKQQLNRRHPFVVDGIHRQQTIVAAAAGDNADADRLIGLLSARCAIREFEQGIGCDVDYVQIASDSDDDDITASATTSKALPASIQAGDGGGLSVTSIAHLARTQISHSLRTRERMNVCLLVAGMVPTTREPQVLEQEQMKIQVDGSSSSSSSISQDDDAKFFQRLQWQVEKASNKVSLKQSNEKNIADTMDINHVASDEELSKHDQGDDNNEDNDGLSLSTDETVDIDDDNMTPSSSPLLKPQLFWLDEYGSIQNIQYGSHGLGSNFILSILDRQYSPNISREEAITLIRDCFHQLRTRYVINNPQPPCIKCVDAHGCQLILQ